MAKDSVKIVHSTSGDGACVETCKTIKGGK